MFLLLPSLSLRLWPRNLRQHLIAERNGFCWANELGTSAETVYALPEKEETPWSGSAEEPDGAAGFQLLLGGEGRLRSRYRRRRESFSKRRKEERRGEETGNPAPEKERLNACSRRDGGDDEGRWVGGGHEGKTATG